MVSEGEMRESDERERAMRVRQGSGRLFRVGCSVGLGPIKVAC